MVTSIPIVCSGMLYYKHGEQVLQIKVGTPMWYTWLMSATIFIFRNSEGTFRACKERSGGRYSKWIWYAYVVKRNGRVRHAYLGESETLLLGRLQTIAKRLVYEDAFLQPAENTLSTRSNACSQPVEANLALLDSPQQESNHLRLIQFTDLIGREQEITTTSALLQRSDTRLVVITGPGGVGKTRLALQVAITNRENFSDGVCYVSLAPIKDAALVIPTISEELGLVAVGEEAGLARVEAYLYDKRLLLLLDNFEQVAEAAPILTDLLLACPDLKILVTSREALRLRIEHELVVPPLALPDLKQLRDVEHVMHYAAVSLFVQRAQAVKPDFQLTSANACIIAEICTRLDGLPLALELAAAHIKLLPPQALLARLEQHRLQILTSGARDVPRRQQTLRNTLSWSYDLLNAKEQLIFRLLSVFVRGCTLKTAEDVCYAINHITINILEVITSLIDKNLLQRAEQKNGDMRILMLETVREYGQECLAFCGEAEATFRAHALYYLALAERAEPELRKAQQAEWLDYLEQEYDNLRTALHWLIEWQEAEAALRICGALCHFWLIRDHQSEGYQWTEKSLSASERIKVSVEIRAKALSVAGILANKQGQFQRSTDLLHKSIAFYRELDDQRGIATVLTTLGNVYARIAPSEAHRHYQESLELSQSQHDFVNVIDTLIALADAATALADFSRARKLFEESLALSKTQGDRRCMAYCLGGLGQITLREGNYAEAHVLLKESLELYREIADRISIAFTLIPLGMATLYQEDYHPVQAFLEERSEASKKLGDPSKIANYLSSLGEVALLSQKGGGLSAQALLAESLAVFKETDNEQGIAAKLFALGCMEYVQGTLAVAIQLLEESLTLFSRLENRAMAAASLSMIGHAHAHQGFYKSARVSMEKSLEISREIADDWTTSYGLSHLGLVALNEGDYLAAHTFMEQSLVVARGTGDPRCRAEALSVMGLLHMNKGDYVSAQAFLEEGLALSKQVSDRYFIAYRLADLGLLAIRNKKATEAWPLVEESLMLAIKMNNKWFIASCLERLGEVVVAHDQPVRATQLWGAAAALRAAIGAPIPNIERAPYEDAITTARTQLGEELFIASWEAGYAMTPNHVIATQPSEEMHRTKELSQLRPTKAVSPSSALPDGLTLREVEVLRLVARGLTNVQIAQQLVISPHTVHAHLSSIYSKLAIPSRGAAMRYAIEHKLS